MPAKIIIEGGEAMPPFSIQEEIFRIGSSAQCKLRLPRPDLAGHIASVEWRDGKYLLYNRSKQVLRLQGKPIEPGKWEPWLPGTRLDLGGGLTLLLEVSGDPAPTSERKQIDVKDVIPDVEDDPGKKTASSTGAGKNLWQVGVLIGCVVLAALSFVFAPQDTPSGQTVNKPTGGITLEQLIDELRQQEQDGPDSLANLLERARMAERRGFSAEAAGLYRRVLLILRQRYGDELQQASQPEQHAEKLARRKLRSK
jgi:hypothetical protein